MNLKKEASSEKIKINSLPTFKAKVSYIWDYYKLPIIGCLCALFFIGAFTYAIKSNDYESIVYAAVSNLQLTNDEVVQLETGFEEYYGLDHKNQRAVIDNAFSMITGDTDADSVTETYSMAVMQKFMALVSTHDLNVLISDEAIFEKYANEGIFLSLDEYLSDDLYEQIKDRTLSYQSQYDTEEHPYGVRLDDCPVLERMGKNTEGLVIAFIEDSKHPEGGSAFMQYLLELD